jgi:hypothetical protein
MIEQIKKAVEASRKKVAVMLHYEGSEHWYPGYLLLRWRNKEGKIRPGGMWVTFQMHPDLPNGCRHIYSEFGFGY